MAKKKRGKQAKKKTNWRQIAMWVFSLLIVISMLLAFIVMAIGPSSPALPPAGLAVPFWMV